MTAVLLEQYDESACRPNGSQNDQAALGTKNKCKMKKNRRKEEKDNLAFSNIFSRHKKRLVPNLKLLICIALFQLRSHISI